MNSYNNITIFYPYRGGITYFKCIEINKVSLSKLRVSFELAHVFAGPSVLVFWKSKYGHPTYTGSLKVLCFCKYFHHRTSSRQVFHYKTGALNLV